MRPALGFTVLLATGLLAVPAVAHADGFISPNVGVNFGGQAGGTLRNAVNVAADEGSKINWGVAAGWMGAGVIGIEEDFAYSPSFFGKGGFIDNSRVVTLMTNGIVGAPIGGQKGGGIRPYGAIGVGWINQNITTTTGVGNFSEDDFGWDIGVAVMVCVRACLACCKCSSSVGSVLDANDFTCESRPALASRLNSFTSFTWSLTITVMYARSNATPFSFSRRCINALSFGSISVGNLMLLLSAICFSCSFAFEWSSTIRCANFLTSSFCARSAASLPSSTSARPPFAASSTNSMSSEPDELTVGRVVFLLVFGAC